MRTTLLLFLMFMIMNSYAQTWTQAIKVAAFDRGALDEFGFNVAISGNYAIVGALREDEDAAGGNSMGEAGSAYIFEKDSNGQWSQVQKIVASDRAASDFFGFAVAINGDYAMIGASSESEDAAGGNTLSAAGSAYVYERNGAGTWNQVQKIVASDRAADDGFGSSISINGNYAIVGAPAEDEDVAGANSINATGSAYIFERDGAGTWNQVQKIVASDRGIIDYFAHSVAISGSYVIVGSYWEDHDVLGGNLMFDAGSAYMFERDSIGTWSEVQKIVASDRGTNDRFATSVSISGDLVLVGAYWEDEDTLGTATLSDAGSAYIFERKGGGTWVETQKIVSSDRAIDDYFGFSVSINGEYAIIGAYQEDEDILGANTKISAGSAYFFKRDSNATWNQVQKIVASDRATVDFFGVSVAISSNNALVGAYWEDEDALGGNIMDRAGSAYLYCLTTSSSIMPSACKSYSSPSGNHTWTSSGVYMDTVPSSEGCDSVITLILTIIKIDTSLTISGSTITANDTGGTYQWLDCENNHSVIEGETNQDLLIASPGSYEVEITRAGCVDTSSCYLSTGIIKNEFGNELTVSPNPTLGNLRIELGQVYSSLTATITNLSGQVILRRIFNDTQNFYLHIDAPSAYYLLDLETDNGKSAVLRIFKD